MGSSLRHKTPAENYPSKTGRHPHASSRLFRPFQSGCLGPRTPLSGQANNPIRAQSLRGLSDMKILPPVSIEARRLLPRRWDLLAAVLVLSFIIAFADASRFLVLPLSSITGHDLRLNPLDLPG